MVFRKKCLHWETRYQPLDLFLFIAFYCTKLTFSLLQVLSGYKSLHRTAQLVFAGDEQALTAVRLRINDEFKKNKHIESGESTVEMLKFAQEVENELKTTVVQAKQKQPGVYGNFASEF